MSLCAPHLYSNPPSERAFSRRRQPLQLLGWWYRGSLWWPCIAALDECPRGYNSRDFVRFVRHVQDRRRELTSLRRWGARRAIPPGLLGPIRVGLLPHAQQAARSLRGDPPILTCPVSQLDPLPRLCVCGSAPGPEGRRLWSSFSRRLEPEDSQYSSHRVKHKLRVRLSGQSRSRN